MGFASGLPFLLSGATLSIWLTEAGVSLTAIGLFALVGTPYNLKYVWAPFIDRVPLPILSKRLGRRRAWMLMIQVGLMAATLRSSIPGAWAPSTKVRTPRSSSSRTSRPIGRTSAVGLVT